MLHCRRNDAACWARPLSPRIVPYLIRAGFYGLYRIGFIQLDHPLITALVERWLQETHTFHFLVGEATVTLQDVSALLGLLVDGEPIGGLDGGGDLQYLQGLCRELLGAEPTAQDFSGGRLKLTWLSLRFQELPDDAEEATVQHYARAYIMQLIGGLVFSDKSQNLVKLMYLPFLRDFNQAG